MVSLYILFCVCGSQSSTGGYLFPRYENISLQWMAKLHSVCCTCYYGCSCSQKTLKFSHNVMLKKEALLSYFYGTRSHKVRIQNSLCRTMQLCIWRHCWKLKTILYVTIWRTQCWAYYHFQTFTET